MPFVTNVWLLLPPTPWSDFRQEHHQSLAKNKISKNSVLVRHCSCPANTCLVFAVYSSKRLKKSAKVYVSQDMRKMVFCDEQMQQIIIELFLERKFKLSWLFTLQKKTVHIPCPARILKGQISFLRLSTDMDIEAEGLLSLLRSFFPPQEGNWPLSRKVPW